MQVEDTKPSLATLSMELHFLIRSQFMQDPETTFNDFKNLRLVCRSLDVVWSPVVLSNIVLFPQTAEGDVLEDLRFFVRDVNYSLFVTQTLTIKTLSCLNIDMHWFVHRHLLKWIQALASVTIVPLVRLFKLLAKPQLFEARRHATLLPQKVNLPNVRCARLIVPHCESNWGIYQSTKVILALPALRELELRLHEYADFPFVTKCLAGICSLQKFKLELRAQDVCSFSTPFSPSSYIDCFRTIIARNPGLTHLALLLFGRSYDLSRLLRDVPAGRPLKLEHLCLDGHFELPDSVLPHIRSLKSFSYGWNNSSGKWCTLFSREGIFPATIRVSRLDKEILSYLKQHPGIVSLTIPTIMTEGDDFGLLRILTQNSKTLRRLVAKSPFLAKALQTAGSGINFLQFESLQELVLYPCDLWKPGWSSPFKEIGDERRIIRAAAGLSRKLTVIVANDKVVFYNCVAYCRVSENSLVRDLAGRIVYEERVDYE